MEDNIDNLLDFDLQSLKISALSNAAKLSPFVSETTIGPQKATNAKVIFKPDLKIEFKNDKILPKPKKSPNESEYNSQPLNRTVKVMDYKAVSYKQILKDLDKRRSDNISKKVIERQNRLVAEENKRQKLFQESNARLQKKSIENYEECERKVLQVLEEQMKLEMEFEEQRRLKIIENNKRILEKKRQLNKMKENANIEVIRLNQSKFAILHEYFAKIIMEIDKPLLVKFTSYNDSVKELLKVHDDLVNSVRALKITESEVAVSQKICNDFEKLIQELKIDINTVLSQALEEQKAIEAKEAALLKQAQEETKSDTTDSVRARDGIQQFVSLSCLKSYSHLMNFYESYAENIKPLTTDESLKSFRFDLQKAINTPVNAISAVSGDHLKDKFNKLAAVLSGDVIVTGDGQISAAQHPLGTQFCTFLLATKFVNQGEKMVSSSAKAAFPIAAIIVALWQKFPDLGKLFLAHLYKECPYLVPYFIPQLEGQTVEDYYKIIGYRYIDNVLEKQDMYLKRMSGIARLYAAILIAKPRRENQSPHPYSLDHGWTWFSNFLNLEPLPDICATLILEFLQIAGQEMITGYGKQFMKLLNVLRNQYFVKLNRVDEGGPKARLEVFLIKIMKERNIPTPEGILPNNFW